MKDKAHDDDTVITTFCHRKQQGILVRMGIKIDHAVVAVLIVDQDTYLLVEEGRPGREGLFNLPGGHVDETESLFDAAIREAKEETGFDIELTGMVGIYQTIWPHINVSGPVFSAIIKGGAHVPSDEHKSIKWVAGQELRQMAEAGKIFTSYPPTSVKHYEERGAFPLDSVITDYHL